MVRPPFEGGRPPGARGARAVRYVHDIPVHGMHAYDVSVHGMHVHGRHVHGIQVHGMHVHRMHVLRA